MNQVEDATDIRMLDFAGDPHLALETLDPALVAGQLAVQNLERNALREDPIEGPEYEARTTFTDAGFDLIAAVEDDPRLEGRRVLPNDDLADLDGVGGDRRIDAMWRRHRRRRRLGHSLVLDRHDPVFE